MGLKSVGVRIVVLPFMIAAVTVMLPLIWVEYIIDLYKEVFG